MGFAMPIVIAIVVFVGVVAGVGYFVIHKQSKETSPLQEREKLLMEKEAMEKKKSEAMPEKGVVLKDGKIMLEENGTMSPLAKDYTFESGVKVTLAGKVTKKDGTAVKLKEGQSVWGDGSIMEAGEKAMMNKEGKMMDKYMGTVLAGTSAPLLDFTKPDYDVAIKSNKLIVLYFYANWCPICKAEFPKMQSAFDELKSDKVIAFRVNYKDSDTDQDEEALAKQFGVAYQHTKVFVKNGERILKAPDGWDKDRYLSEINKLISS